jgi:putative Holliday junction resolvase
VIDDVKSKYNACAFVIGLPLHLDGKISNQTRIVEEFACNLYKHLNIIIYLQDERLTTKAANNLLKMFNNESRLYKRQEDDAIAASMILETTLDSIKNLKNHL